MSNLKALKARINSVKSTQKMTKAMKMVAASKLRKAKEVIENARPYAEKIGSTIESIVSRGSNPDDKKASLLLFGQKDSKDHLILVISSDRGLCGGLNSSVVKQVKNQIADLKKTGKNAKLICVGKKAYEQLKSAFDDIIINSFFDIFKGIAQFDDADKIAKHVIKLLQNGEIGSCSIIYNRFVSTITQHPVSSNLVPARLTQNTQSSAQSNNVSNARNKGKNGDANAPIEYEPNEAEILKVLLPKNLSIQIYKALLENAASEQGARMTAMENATNNAGEMIKKLTLVYNRTRQANITRELIDIISGAQAV